MKSMRSMFEEAFPAVVLSSTGDNICCSKVHPDESELVSEKGFSRPKHPNFSASELPVRIESRSSSLSVSHDFCNRNQF